MKVVIADDEPLARRRLEMLLAECADVEVVASVGDAEEALAACARLQPDLAILDIRMPGLDGLAAARRLRETSTIRIIFCTAYEQHAIDAWEVRASDYLLKPVTSARLREALARVRDPAGGRHRVWLHAHRHGEDLRLALDEILYLSAEDKYVTAHLASGSVLLEDSLKSLLEAWPEHLLQLHRAVVIPRDRLLAVRVNAEGGAEARIAGSEVSLPVSRRMLPAVRQLLRGSSEAD